VTLLTKRLEQALETRIVTGTSYMGIVAWKNPLDAWVYQELIYETRPEVIVEVGNNAGGSLLYLAHLCDLLGAGRVIGVDCDHDKIDEEVRRHGRIELVTGDAALSYPLVVDAVRGESALVIEDSSHTYENTLSVLRLYSALIAPGGYLIVEDGVMKTVAAAIATFLSENPAFEPDRSREWPITWNPDGFLRCRA